MTPRPLPPWERKKVLTQQIGTTLPSQTQSEGNGLHLCDISCWRPVEAHRQLTSVSRGFKCKWNLRAVFLPHFWRVQVDTAEKSGTLHNLVLQLALN